MDKDIPSLNMEFTGKFIRAFWLRLPRIIVSDVENYFFARREDAENCLAQLSSCKKGGAEVKRVIVLQIGDDYIFLEKFCSVVMQPIGSVPYLSPEEMANW